LGNVSEPYMFITYWLRAGYHHHIDT
jgi:hypothetical protein